MQRRMILRRLFPLLALLVTTTQCQLFSPVSPAPTAVGGIALSTVAAPASEESPSDAAELPAVTLTVELTPTPTSTATQAPSATPLPTMTPAPTSTATATVTATATPLPHPLYCAQPPEDYSRVALGEHILNGRTLAMLQVAQQIYAGPGDIMRITQGSYRDVVAVSFGTHAGGGAVDISIRDPRNEGVFLWEEAEPMVMALRYAGFAAWFRDVGDLGENSAAHIHAVAVGDAELSAAAQEQVTGAGGYLAGMDGLIEPYGPNADRHGGPVVCEWME